MYEPQVNDYVRWVTELGQVHEGWVYFKADSVEEKRGWKKPSRYITIEIYLKGVFHPLLGSTGSDLKYTHPSCT